MFVKNTVDKVMKQFTTTIEALDGIAESETTRAGDLLSASSRIQEDARQADMEAARARSIARKLRDIVD